MRQSSFAFTAVLNFIFVAFFFAASPNAIAQDLPLLKKESETKVETGESTDSESEDSISESNVDTDNDNGELSEDILFGGKSPNSIEQLRMMEKHFADLSTEVESAVVNIQIMGSQGSGVVISEDGYILTAAHVIGRPNRQATITFPDGKEVKATTLGSSTRVDSGMLKINDDQGDSFPFANVGLSSGLKSGQWVMAIGHPGGIDKRRGLVVRVGRILFRDSNVLRTDCTLVGGDSGGPLFDMNGEVVGIHSRIGLQLWTNLHVPIDTYSDNWDQLSEGVLLDGKGSLGFSVVGDSPEVESVAEKGATAKAGLEVGDIILKINSKKIKDRGDIVSATKNIKPYLKMKFVVERDGEEKTLNVVVASK